MALAAVALLPGCARTVSLADPAVSAADQATCTALMAGLPATVLDQERRTVEPGVFTAAWGKPIITLRCGVPKPVALTDSSQCFEVNGVGWFAEEGTGGYLFTTIGRRTFVELGVPGDYAPEASALVDVAATVAAHDPLIKPCV